MAFLYRMFGLLNMSEFNLLLSCYPEFMMLRSTFLNLYAPLPLLQPASVIHPTILIGLKQNTFKQMSAWKCGVRPNQQHTLNDLSEIISSIFSLTRYNGVEETRAECDLMAHQLVSNQRGAWLYFQINNTFTYTLHHFVLRNLEAQAARLRNTHAH